RMSRSGPFAIWKSQKSQRLLCGTAALRYHSAVDSNQKPGKLAHEVAEAILSAMFGPDLIGCRIAPDAIAPLIQQALDAHAKKEGMVNSLFVQVLEKIRLIATPPERNQIVDAAQLATMLGERADAILQITSQTLSAWAKLKTSDETERGI
ncbi:MAG: hypothetical protein L0Z50_35010, partial [Verrucomicrobiales bacterium]|nr:hypothetical protein [Verrucomicrobiales bacterium]